MVINQFYPVENSTRSVSLAVRVLDDFTLKEPVGSINVSLRDACLSPIKKPEGYFIFLDLIPGNYSVVTNSQYYLDREITVDTASLDPQNPVLNVNLTPTSAFPFFGNTALIRATVRGAGGSKLPGAKVLATVISPKEGNNNTPLVPFLDTGTNENGEFVIYFRTLKVHKFTVRIQVEHANYQTFYQEVEATADKQVSLGEIQLTTA